MTCREQDDDALVPLSKPMMDFEAWKMKLHGKHNPRNPRVFTVDD